MAFFPGIGAKEGVKGPKVSIGKNPPTASSATRGGMTGAKGRLPGSSTSNRTKPPKRTGSKANPFAPVLHKNVP